MSKTLSMTYSHVLQSKRKQLHQFCTLFGGCSDGETVQRWTLSILKGFDMYFVKFLVIMMLVLASLVMAFTVIYVSLGVLAADWLLIAIPYIGVCLLSVWAAD
jgi:hypothetical protein